MTRDERIAAAAAKAMADQADRDRRRDALAEARHELNTALRASVGSGPRAMTMDAAQATPEQRQSLDNTSNGGEPLAPTRTREEINRDMNEALRARHGGGEEQDR